MHKLSFQFCDKLLNSLRVAVEQVSSLQTVLSVAFSHTVLILSHDSWGTNIKPSKVVIAISEPKTRLVHPITRPVDLKIDESHIDHFYGINKANNLTSCFKLEAAQKFVEPESWRLVFLRLGGRRRV